MTRITLETCYGKVTIEVPEDDMALPELLDKVIVPALLAQGFGESTVRDVLGEP